VRPAGRLLLISLSSAAGLCACHNARPTVQAAPLRLSVDSTAYHRHGREPMAVRYTLTNTGSSTLYVRQCGGAPVPGIERISWGSWRFWEGGFCNGGSASLLPLAPGDSVDGTVTFYSGGRYRLGIGAVTDSGDEGRTAVSPGFDVW
jgi:hypothetical protein